MKYLVLIISFLSLISIADAQEPLFLKGDKKINVGIGFSNFPIGSVSLDYAIVDGIFDDGSIGVGPYAGIGFSSLFTYFVAGARGTFHYPLIENLDTYGGATIGLRYAMSGYRDNGIFFTPGLFLGANYPLNKNIIVFGEIGSGVTYLTAGITLILE